MSKKFGKKWGNFKDFINTTAEFVAGGCILGTIPWLFYGLFTMDVNIKRPNVCIKNNKDKNELVIKDIKDKKERTLFYNPKDKVFRFVEPNDTLFLDMAKHRYRKKYRKEKIFTYDVDPNFIDDDNIQISLKNATRRYKEFKNAEAAKKQELKRQQEFLRQRQECVTDSLRDIVASIPPKQRKEWEENILSGGTDMQRNALVAIKIEEQKRRDKYIADSIADIKEKARIKAEQERIKADQERIAEAKRQKMLRDRETNKAIIKHKKDGTLWQYLAQHDTILRDTATVIRVYNTKRFDASGNANYSSSLGASYSSSSNTEPISGDGLLLGRIGFGGIEGGSSESHASGSASGHANGNAGAAATYQEVSAVVARDRYGYTYTFPIDPMMDVAKGDKIVLQYKGRSQNSTGYIDNVKLLHIMYQRTR